MYVFLVKIKYFHVREHITVFTLSLFAVLEKGTMCSKTININCYYVLIRVAQSKTLLTNITEEY